jgi:hypothetical protein
MSTCIDGKTQKEIFELCFTCVDPGDANPKPVDDPTLRFYQCQMCSKFGKWSNHKKGYGEFSQHVTGKHSDDVDKWYAAFRLTQAATEGKDTTRQGFLPFVDAKATKIFQWLDKYSLKPNIPLAWMEDPEYLKYSTLKSVLLSLMLLRFYLMTNIFYFNRWTKKLLRNICS